MEPSIAAAVGRPGATWTETTRDAGQSRVWRLDGDGPTVYVKVHRNPGKYGRERDGLLRLAGHDLAPALLAHHDDLRLLVIAACPGEGVGLDGVGWQAAGAALARLHRLPCPPDAMPLSEALPRRLRGWCARAVDRVPPDRVAALAAQAGDGAAFVGAERVFCHRDFAPRNWRWAGGRCRIFDLEHAGPDAAEADLVRLYEGPFAERPGLATAFFAGYGARPDPDRLQAMLALHALATLTWGRLHDDPAFVERGDRLADRLLGAPPASR